MHVAKVRTCPIIVALLLVAIGALAYKFIVAGSTDIQPDGRVGVVLTPPERDLVLREMRGFVEGTQAITAALARNDVKAAGIAARGLGTARAHDAPASLFAKLPLEFKSMALGLHRGFDTMAADAESGGSPAHALEQLSTSLQGCVACHARYAISTAPRG